MTKLSLQEQSKHGSPLFPMHIYLHRDPNCVFFVPYHWHNEIELLYIEQGEFQINLNETIIHAKEGELYFINSHELHQISAINNKPSLHYAIVFNPELLGFELYDYCQSYYIAPLINKTLQFPTIIDDNHPIKGRIISEFKDAVFAYRNKTMGWPITVKAALFKIIALLIQEELMLNESASSLNDNYKINLAKKIITYIQGNYENKIMIDELAEVANMSPQYFCKFFKSIFGKTAIQYINEYRIEKACELLQHSDTNIIEICFAVGFENFSYFIKKFKQFKNYTPSAYRENFIKKIDA